MSDIRFLIGVQDATLHRPANKSLVLRESLIRVPQTLSAFHPHAQRTAFRRRDVRPQPK
jgi:hypothetical protein